MNDQKITFGELTVLKGRRVYTVFLASPSKNKARDAVDLVISDLPVDPLSRSPR